MHKCDSRLCCNFNHLKLGTIADNNRDMVNKGRQAKGEKNGRSKIKWDDAIEITSLYRTSQYSQKQLAEWYSISQQAVSAITTEKYWKLPLAN